MNTSKKNPPRRLREREGESEPSAENVSHIATASKPFDEVEKKLNLVLDALIDAIEAYREARL